MCLDLLFIFDGVLGGGLDLSNSNPKPKKMVWTESELLNTLATANIIPDSGARKGYGSASSVQSGITCSHLYSSSNFRRNPGSPFTSGPLYAGAKFCQAPPAANLPKPPAHWTSPANSPYQTEQLEEMSNLLKMLLNIEA